MFLDHEKLFASRTAGKPGVGIWSVSTGKLLRELKSESVCLGENEDQSAMITLSPGPPRSLRFWGLREFDLLREVALPPDLDPIYCPRLTRDRKSVVLGQLGKVIEIDCATGRLRETMLFPGKGIIVDADLSPDRHAWAAITGPFNGTGNGRGYLSASSGSVLRLQGEHVFDIEFSPTEPILATVGTDSKARLCELPSGRQLAVLAGHKEGVFDCDFSPDGKILATASGDKTVTLWHVATRREMVSLQHNQPVVVCVFSPEGNYLATGTIDQKYHFLRAASWEEIDAVEANETAVTR